MARERDDEFEDDDRPRRRDRDDDYDDRPRGDARVGRDKVKAPGLFLALTGGLSLVLAVGSLALSILAPGTLTDPMFDAIIDFTQKQPATPQQAGQIAQFQRQKIDARQINPVNVVFGVIGLALNAVTLLGGLQMRGASGYGMAMAGAICGVVPLSGCCCVTMPAGIWALVVLLNQDAKAAFARSASGPDVGADLGD